MNQEKLTRDLIPQPELWRCILEICSDRIDAVLVPPVSSEHIIHSIITLNPDAPSADKAIQEAIYENPLLLSDFKSIDALIDARSYTMAPRQFLDYTSTDEVLKTCCIDKSDCEECISAPADGIAVVYAVAAALTGFLRRTFFNVRINHRISPLIASHISSSGLFAVAEHGRLDIIATDRGRLLAANTFEYKNPIDAAYYILACAKELRAPESEIFLAGTDYAQVSQVMGQHAGYPKPVQCPASLLAMGKDAVTLPQSITALLS